jgi:hypothetical protein
MLHKNFKVFVPADVREKLHALAELGIDFINDAAREKLASAEDVHVIVRNTPRIYIA